MTVTRALITGAAGQDGWYLTKHLLDLGYQVTALLMYAEGAKREALRADFPTDRLQFVFGNVQDFGSVLRILRTVKPYEIYNLAAETFVPDSWKSPWLFFEVNTRGVLNFVEAIVLDGLNVRFYQASTSEMYGNATPPQNERTPFHPSSPYGAAKLAAHQLVTQYRTAYGVYACCGICFNHESPRRPMHFVSRKITSAAAEIARGKAQMLRLGNLTAVRDWGHAQDAVRAMTMMLHVDGADDYVIGSGVSHTVWDLVKTAFRAVGLNPADHVVSSGSMMRPNDDLVLKADATKAREVLGWAPTVTFEDMIEEMVQHDLRLIDAPGGPTHPV